MLVLDAGTGIRGLGKTIDASVRRVDILLTHLHMDHIQGLGFFAPLFRPDLEVRIWGPVSSHISLRERLMRYLSPPLFPVSLRELPCMISLHDVPCGEIVDRGISHDVGAGLPSGADRGVPHRRCAGQRVDLSAGPRAGAGRVGVSVAASRVDLGRCAGREADLLIHDSQYSAAEYPDHVGWGHSSFKDALAFAALSDVKHFVPFHHDPGHTDVDIDRMMEEALAEVTPACRVTTALEGATFLL